VARRFPISNDCERVVNDLIYAKLLAKAELEPPARKRTSGDIALMVVMNGIWYALVLTPVIYFWVNNE
jgi:hypothetical protein